MRERFALLETVGLSASAAAGGAAQTAVQSYVSDQMVHAIVPGVVFGLAGGVAAAIMPWMEGTGGWRRAISAISLAIIVGGLSGAFLTSLYWVDEGYKACVEAACGFLAYEILRRIRQAGPSSIIDWLVRRREDAALDEVKKKEPTP